MTSSVEQLVRQIHNASAQFVLVMTGGGSRAIADLLEVPGGSRVLIEAVVPYAEPAMIAWLGSRPDQFCAEATARAMAVVAFGRARQYGAADDRAAGVACTAGLAADRPKRGPHRAHVALQTASRTISWSVELTKGARTRAEEESVVASLILNAMAEAGGRGGEGEKNIGNLGDETNKVAPDASDSLHTFHTLQTLLTFLPLLPPATSEHVERSEVVAAAAWRELFLGQAERVYHGPSGQPGDVAPRAILPGAFNPMHVGHRRMAQIGEEILGEPVALELSILNVDKPPLDYAEIKNRLSQTPPGGVWLTRAATFEEKSRLFPGATFLVGADTIARIASPRYYSGDPDAVIGILQRIASRGCRFLVFARHMGAGLVRLAELELPEVLRNICREVPPERFREDVSSTAIRKSHGAE